MSPLYVKTPGGDFQPYEGGPWDGADFTAYDAQPWAAAPEPPPPGGAGYVEPTPDAGTWGSMPVLTEQFTGTGLDWGVWTPRTGSVSNNNAYYQTQNVVVRNGNLEILSRLESAGGKPYTSGDIQAYGYGAAGGAKWKTPTNYFKASVRAKLPLEMGFWCAPLWFRPIFNGTTTVGEIDVMESYGGEVPNFKIHGDIHHNYTDPSHRHAPMTVLFSSLNLDPYDWHVYTMEKTPGRIQMWCDGFRFYDKGTGDPTWYNEVYEVAGTTWSPRVTVQIDATTNQLSGTPGPGNDWSAAKTTMFVDYIKVWRMQ